MNDRSAPRLPNAAPPAGDARPTRYRLDEQIGFLLRRATQRHLAIFAAGMGGRSGGPDLTPMQWAVLAKLHETGPSAQNLLGRNTAMDAATVKGVVDRLVARGLAETRPDPADGRRRTVALTEEGRQLVERLTPYADAVTEETLAPLTATECDQLAALLKKLG